ncbi:MAG: hypothetical protein H0V44_16595, partial [Planctomycetes bacterium]|nr:hypothetical protein [Planctomycetota bacterium]
MRAQHRQGPGFFHRATGRLRRRRIRQALLEIVIGNGIVAGSRPAAPETMIMTNRIPNWTFPGRSATALTLLPAMN